MTASDELRFAAGDLTMGQLNALVKALISATGSKESVKEVLAGYRTIDAPLIPIFLNFGVASIPGGSLDIKIAYHHRFRVRQNDFCGYVLKNASKVTHSVNKLSWAYSDLRRPVTDNEIAEELDSLNGQRTFTALSDFLVRLYFLIGFQSNGQEGKLLTNGKWNIFHVDVGEKEPRCIMVEWYDGHEWRLHHKSFGNRWQAGDRVFWYDEES